MALVTARTLPNTSPSHDRLPAALCALTLARMASFCAQGLSKLVVSSATRCVHLVRPRRPKFLTCGGGRGTAESRGTGVGECNGRTVWLASKYGNAHGQRPCSQTRASWAAAKLLLALCWRPPAPHHPNPAPGLASPATASPSSTVSTPQHAHTHEPPRLYCTVETETRCASLCHTPVTLHGTPGTHCTARPPA